MAFLNSGKRDFLVQVRNKKILARLISLPFVK